MKTLAFPRDTDVPETEESCALCRDDVFHCHEVSVAYPDGANACGDPWCTLPHHLHEWQAA